VSSRANKWQIETIHIVNGPLRFLPSHLYLFIVNDHIGITQSAKERRDVVNLCGQNFNRLSDCRKYRKIFEQWVYACQVHPILHLQCTSSKTTTE
jgi:hypothetical protein